MLDGLNKALKEVTRRIDEDTRKSATAASSRISLRGVKHWLEAEINTEMEAMAQAMGGEAPDKGCITHPDGDCVGDDCMHTQPEPPKEE